MTDYAAMTLLPQAIEKVRAAVCVSTAGRRIGGAPTKSAASRNPGTVRKKLMVLEEDLLRLERYRV